MSGPLSINLSTSTAKTILPTIPEGTIVAWRLVSISMSGQAENKPVLTWEFDLINPTADKSGKPINPGDFGSKLFHKVFCYAKPDAKDPNWFHSSIAKLQDALLGTGDADNDKGKPPRPDFNDETAAHLIGKELCASMKVKPEEFGGGNEFGRLYFPADVPKK